MDEQMSAARRIDAGELSARVMANGRELLRYEIIYPRINAKTPAENRINRYHQAQAKAFERLIKNKYLPEARRQHKELDADGAFAPLEVSASFQVMLSTDAVLSLFTDTYFQLRHSGCRLARSSKTYDLNTGQPVRLGSIFSRGAMLREALAASLEPQIASEDARNPGQYFAGWRQLYMQNVKDDAYYLTDGGVVIYFQQEVIASANAGLPSFLVPYEAFGAPDKYGIWHA